MTTDVTLTKDWTLVATSAQNFLLSNGPGSLLQFAAVATQTTPTIAGGHAVPPLGQFARYGTAGPCPPGYVYGRIASEAPASAAACALDTWAMS